MAYPSTTILPPSPSRISDPVNFVNESALYLQNLPNFRTQFNALTAYINTKYPNYNNYGTVVDSNPVMPTVATFATGVSGTGVAYISSLDTFYENLYTNSSRANSYGAWIDSVMTITGTGSTDTVRAQVPAISAAATRSQTRTAFNTSSILFTETAIKSVRELASAFNYINTNAFGSFDNGLVTAAIDATDDYGRLKATYLDGTKNLDGTYTLSVTQTTNDIVLQDSVTSLFAGGLEGVAYDFNDLSTLFQDHEGRTPVTAAGQPVGLVLDKSKGSATGINLHTPTTPMNATSYPATGTRSGLDITVSQEVLAYASVSLGMPTVVGKTYLLELIAPNAAGFWILVSDSAEYDTRNRRTAIEAAPESKINTKITFIFTASAAVTYIHLNRGISVTSPVTFKDVSVREVLGNHAYQTTPASRPLLQRNATTGAYYLAFDGTDDYLVTNSINFTATDKISLFAGVRKLSDATQIITELSEDSNINYGSFYLAAGSDIGVIGYTSMGVGSAGSGVGKTAQSFTYKAPDSAVLSVKHDISGNLSSIRRNGVVGVDGTGVKGTGNFGNYPLYIGRHAGTTLPFSGHIYALVIVGKFASDGEIYETETILADRVGILV